MSKKILPIPKDSEGTTNTSVLPIQIQCNTLKQGNLVASFFETVGCEVVLDNKTLMVQINTVPKKYTL